MTIRKKPAMSGNKLLIDTNVFIRLFEGDDEVAALLHDNHLFVSVITEMELLGFFEISESDKQFYKAVLNDCSLVELTQSVKERTIALKQQYKVRLPDAIIAATADYLNIPLLTFDKGFSKFKDIDILLLEIPRI